LTFGGLGAKPPITFLKDSLWRTTRNALAPRLKRTISFEVEHKYMTKVVAEFVAEVRSNLIDEIELAYSKAFADLRLEIVNLRLELVKLNGNAAGPIDLPNAISRLAN
jgi:hypothetical protein